MINDPEALLAQVNQHANRRGPNRPQLTTDRAPNCCCDQMNPAVREKYGQCALCNAYQYDPVFFAKWRGLPSVKTEQIGTLTTVQMKPCSFRGSEIRDENNAAVTRWCGPCVQNLKTFPCAFWGLNVTPRDCENCANGFK